jgi:hypothetical protein
MNRIGYDPTVAFCKNGDHALHFIIGNFFDCLVDAMMSMKMMSGAGHYRLISTNPA